LFQEFSHRHTPCVVDGNEEKVILSRETKATTVMGKEYVYNGVFSPSSSVDLGMTVETDALFLVLTKRDTVGRDKYCSLLKTNVTITVQRYTQAYDEKDNPIGGPEFKPVAESISSFAQYVTAQLKMDEPGLLSTTKYVLVLQCDRRIGLYWMVGLIRWMS